ncbi:hypothetical protein T06_3858 [Trichinella sp. T6]|nr:hypothetical protein T06_1522 [Trichinella sp. T6]KRX75296.1 hypothetical protein T06_3858 [Trichinella sp. T6]
MREQGALMFGESAATYVYRSILYPFHPYYSLLYEINSSNGISKFIFDPGVHRLYWTPKPLSTP